jgi:ketosteroid isomerase-like protein
MASRDAETVRRFYAEPYTEWPRLLSEIADPEIEVVTRDGTLRGHDAALGELPGFVEATERRFIAEFELEEIVEAGDGVLIALLAVTRRSREAGGDYLNAWPATVWRFRDGRIVFFEGYQDRRKALSEYGIER